MTKCYRLLLATFVVDSSGKITYAFVSEDYKRRAPSKEIIKSLKALR